MTTEFPIGKIIIMNKILINIITVISICLFTIPVKASALEITDLDSGLTPEALVESLLGQGVEVSNITYTGDNVSAGFYEGGEDVGIGMSTGVILSSGRIAHVIGPNDRTGTSNQIGQPGDTDLSDLIGAITYDAAVLEFDFIPVGNSISFKYVMGSDEYPEYLSFSDVFGFFLDGKNIALLPDSMTPVSISNVNHETNSEYYVSNSSGEYDIQCDGFTAVLEVLAQVTPGQTHHIKLAVADKGDSKLDTWVFIESGSFVSGTDVAVSITDPVNPQLNGTATYSVVISNFGPHKADNVEAIIRLPDSVSFSNASITKGTFSETNGRLTCIIGTMAKEESVTVTINVQVKSLPPGICIAQVATSSYDLDMTNNHVPAYQLPIAVNDSYSVVGNTLNVAFEKGVISNDTSVSVSGETVELVSGASHGVLNLNDNGSFTYTPVKDYFGADQFSYRIWDQKNYSNTASVKLTITPDSGISLITEPVNGSVFIDPGITVRGNAHPAAIVEIFVNGVSQGTTVGSGTGFFSKPGVHLSDGENSITAVSTDSYGVTSPPSSPVTVHLNPRPQTPAGVAAVPGDTVVTITWNPNSETDVQGYYVYRDKDRLNIEPLAQATYKDTRLTDGKEYAYTVTAVDGNNTESKPAGPVSVTPVAGPEW